jgi:hypothetical protein
VPVEWLATIDYVPWRTYNPDVQAVCDRVICLTEMDSVDMMAAYDSLEVCHRRSGEAWRGRNRTGNPYRRRHSHTVLVHQLDWRKGQPEQLPKKQGVKSK